MTPPALSVIVPAYNEARRLGATLDALLAWRDAAPFPTEIVVVDDGSRDGTAGLVRDRADTGVRLIVGGTNRGKGHAVGLGVAAACGDRVLFCDADLATPPSEYARLSERLDAGYDVAIGSRALPGSVVATPRPWRRRLMSRAFTRAVQRLALSGVADAMCGFKLFTRDAARAIFARRTIDGFAFDVELLVIARRLGLRVAEVPITWHEVPGSTVSPARHSLLALRDVVLIRHRHGPADR